MIKDLSNSKKKVEEELQEFKKQFEVPEQEVKLIPYNYPDDIQKDLQLKIEADRVRRQIEYDRLEEERKKAMERNKETA